MSAQDDANQILAWARHKVEQQENENNDTNIRTMWVTDEKCTHMTWYRRATQAEIDSASSLHARIAALEAQLAAKEQDAAVAALLDYIAEGDFSFVLKYCAYNPNWMVIRYDILGKGKRSYFGATWRKALRAAELMA